MSSILKAIKKRNEVTPQPVEPLSPPVTRGNPSRRHLIPLLAGAAVGGLLVGCFLLWPKSPDDTSLLAETPLVVPTQTALTPERFTSPVANSEPVEERTPVIKRAPVIVPPVESVVVVMNEPEPISVAEPKSPSLVKELPASPKTVPVAVVKTEPVVAEPPLASNETDRTVETVLPDGIELKVTEIFFQEGHGNSMAIINDLPVMEGTPIDSAMVEEITPDHVQFLISGKTYLVESSLTQSQ